MHRSCIQVRHEILGKGKHSGVVVNTVSSRMTNNTHNFRNGSTEIKHRRCLDVSNENVSQSLLRPPDLLHGVLELVKFVSNVRALLARHCWH